MYLPLCHQSFFCRSLATSDTIICVIIYHSLFLVTFTTLYDFGKLIFFVYCKQAYLHCANRRCPFVIVGDRTQSPRYLVPEFSSAVRRGSPYNQRTADYRRQDFQGILTQPLINTSRSAAKSTSKLRSQFPLALLTMALSRPCAHGTFDFSWLFGTFILLTLSIIWTFSRPVVA